MPKLSDDQLRARRAGRGLKAAEEGLTQIMNLHFCDSANPNHLKYCSLCFMGWPCETNRTAAKALDLVKKGLS